MVKKGQSNSMARAFHKLTGCINDRWEFVNRWVKRKMVFVCLYLNMFKGQQVIAKSRHAD